MTPKKEHNYLDQVTADRLGELTPNFLNFLELHPDEQAWIYPLLGRAEKRTIDTLLVLQNKFLTYEEIASAVGCHPNTAKSTLYALSKYGLTTYNGKTKRWATPKGGRNRILKKLGDFEQ